MAEKKQKLPHDPHQRAKSIVDIATGETDEPIEPASTQNPAAMELGRLGGLKGGKACAEDDVRTTEGDRQRGSRGAAEEKREGISSIGRYGLSNIHFQ
ncbi:MAG: hypothetical protein JWQ98_354 [Chlorobi bacterium]|nr:hypothetical protein [Chlorobiota bacterium]